MNQRLSRGPAPEIELIGSLRFELRELTSPALLKDTRPLPRGAKRLRIA
jgi:hypothetical protein